MAVAVAAPVRLSFQPSRNRRKQQLARMRMARAAHEEPQDGVLSRSPSPPCQDLESYLRSSKNTNLDPSLPSPATLAPYEDPESAFPAHVDMAQPLNARPKCFRNLFEEVIFIFTVMMATSATTFVQGVIVINTALIGRDLQMTSAQITWIAAAIGLTSGSFMLFCGKTADIFGGKGQLLGGMACLSLFSLIIGFTSNAMEMNIMCGFLGLGTAAIAPPAIGIMFETYPEGIRRNRAAGALGSGNPIGFVMGSISAGLATKIYGWRSSFIVISIFFFVLTLMATWTMPSIPRSGNLKTEAKKFDWCGTFLIIMGMALFCAALTEGPVRGWKSSRVIVMLIFGFLLLVGFVLWENLYRFPLLNMSVWRNRNYTLCVLCTFFGYMSFITNQFWICLYQQDVQKLAPLHIAVRMLPQALAGILWSFVGQALVHRLSGTVLMGVGALAYLLGAVLQIFIQEHTSYWKLLFPSLVITVLGADFQFIVSNLYITKQMGTQASLGAGVLQTAMRLSVSLGLSITAAVYGSSVSTPQAVRDITFAFDRAYLCSILFATVGLLFVPFMRIAKQGASAEIEKTSAAEMVEAVLVLDEERPRTGGEYQDEETQTPSDDQALVWSECETSLTSCATYGSYGPRHESWLPRWSWEDERAWREQRCRDFGGEEHVVYEVCIKCLAEKRRVVSSSGSSRYIGGYEPTHVQGRDLVSIQAATYDVRLSTPKAESYEKELGSGGENSNSGTVRPNRAGSGYVGKGGVGWL